MGRLLNVIVGLVLLGALLAPSNAVAQSSPAAPADAGAAAPDASKDEDQLVISKLVQGCLDACRDEIKERVGAGKDFMCYTTDQLNGCLQTRTECAGSWDALSLDSVMNLCSTFGTRMCGCGGKAAEKPDSAKSTAAKRGKKSSTKKAVTRTLTPEDDCMKRGGAWVTVEKPKMKDDGSESGETVSVQECKDFTDVWMTLQNHERRIKGLEDRSLQQEKPFTDEEIASLQELLRTRAEGPLEREIEDLIKALKALCRTGSTAAVSAEATGDAAKVYVQCDTLRDTIAQADARSREALDRANAAYTKADEAGKKADAADEKADRALNATRSNLRVVGAIGAYAKRTPDYGSAIKGDTTVVYAGGGMGWNPCFQSGVCLSLSGMIGSSFTQLFGSRSFTVRAGVGLGTHLNKSVFIGGEVFSQSFVWPNEWNKLHMMGIQPVAVFTLAQLAPGVDLVASAELQLGVMRNLKPEGAGGGIQQDPQIGLSGGLGIGF